jgi:hypothetical protein
VFVVLYGGAHSCHAQTRKTFLAKIHKIGVPDKRRGKEPKWKNDDHGIFT